MSRAWPCVRIAIGGGAITETVARMRTRGSPSKRMDTIVRVRPRIARLSGEPERATLFGLLIPLSNQTSTEWRLRNPGIKGARGRSEERRVGKECGCRWWGDSLRKRKDSE